MSKRYSKDHADKEWLKGDGMVDLPAKWVITAVLLVSLVTAAVSYYIR